MESKLLDLRDCHDEEFRRINEQMQDISLKQQPAWFRPLLHRNRFLQRWVGHDVPTRAWEYPWAVKVARLGQSRLRTLDVGGGASPFAIYLAMLGHDSVVADPSLPDQSATGDLSTKGPYRSLRSLLSRLVAKALGVNRRWGLPNAMPSPLVSYYPYSATHLEFPDRSFDRVFCLSVMEHIPLDQWGRCMKEFERVLRPGGRLLITLDMSTPQADCRLYLRLIGSSALTLCGNPNYAAPITVEDKKLRHPSHTYETIGLAWQA